MKRMILALMLAASCSMPVRAEEVAAGAVKPQAAHTFTASEIAALIDAKAKEAVAAHQAEIEKAKQEAIAAMSKFKVTGVAFCVDANVACIYDNQNPTFELTYKDEKGEVKTRTYEGSITSWGLKVQLAGKFNIIFITSTDFDFYNSNKVIELGMGVDLSLNGFLNLLSLIGRRQNMNILLHRLTAIEFLYAPFKNTPGALVVLSWSGIGVGDGLSVVTGGTLTPTA